MQPAQPWSLPPEILAAIFEHLRALSPVGDIENYRSPFTSTWLSVSHVSQLWRAASLGHTMLWTTITSGIMAHIELYKLFLQRSGAALLDVDAGVAQDWPSQVQYLLKEVHRVRRLKIVVDSHDPLTSAPAIPFVNMVNLMDNMDPAPCMLSFDLAPVYHSMANEISYQAPLRMINRIQLAAPALRSLSLSCTPFSWAEASSNLRELTLDMITIPGASINDILDNLRRMPLLEKLALSHALPEDDGHPEIYPVVHLPRLQVLHLDEDGDAGTHFLQLWSSIEAHPENYTRIVGSSATAELILQVAARALSRYSSTAGYLSCPLYLQVAFEVEIKLFFCPLGTTMQRMSLEQSFLHPGLELSLLEEFESTHVRGSGHMNLWSGLAATLPLQRVVHLHVPYDDVDGTETREIATFTRRMTSLERLSFEHLHPIGLEYISHALSQSPQSSGGSLPLPALRRIDLQFCTFDAGSVETLLNALAQRAQVGLKLHQMTVGFSGFGEEWLERFEEVVYNVGWDYEPLPPE
ncbi:unnamed protein product [Peniophora sp. CBMAI 1063]|nr:unnamed protein product [Peniophora sp. CBMAI 1063]